MQTNAFRSVVSPHFHNTASMRSFFNFHRNKKVHAASSPNSRSIVIDGYDDDELAAQAQQAQAASRRPSPPPGFPSALWEIDLLDPEQQDSAVEQRTIERWIVAYNQLANDAVVIGIPHSAIPPLPQNPTKQELRGARDLLNGMIQSFLSSGL